MAQTNPPKRDEPVLGEQLHSPSADIVLEEFQQQFTFLTTEQKIAILADVLQQGDHGIDFLSATLNDERELIVRATAYQLLQLVDSDKAKAAISNGILLNPGDLIYCVYKSPIQFNDEFFCLESELQNLDFIDEVDWDEFGYADYEDFCRSEEYNYDGGEMCSYIPKRVARYFSKAAAETAAEKLHQKLVSEWDYPGSFEESPEFVLNQWCQANQISSTGDGYLGYLSDLMDELKAEGNFELLGKLWRDSVGNFTFVHEETIRESQYLQIEHSGIGSEG